MLKEYGAKRDFERTPEPPPEVRPDSGPLVFVIQKHAARRLHYDLRLELDGVLKSWSVPNGPSLDPKEKRLAVMVEDHPLDYAGFEGVIPRGQYGAGEVIVWDEGAYSPEHAGQYFFDDRQQAQALVRDGLAKGKLSFFLRGHKLHGSWTLVRMQNSPENWLLIKHQDEFAGAGRDVLKEDKSVASGLSIADLKAGKVPGRANTPHEELDKVPGARRAPFPDSPLAPMLATLVPEPFTDPAWFFEPKLDGYRTIAFIRDGAVTLYTRRGNDNTGKFRAIADELKTRPVSEVILDGEIIALDDSGKPSFQVLQQYLERLLGNPAPILYYVFDILYLDGYDLRNVPLQRRKHLLETVLANSDSVRRIDYYPADGPAVFRAAVANGFEGVVGKRLDSVYEAGRRSRSWLKIKAVRSEDFVIGGYTKGAGTRANTFGALLVGYYNDAGKLVYAGHVGTGFNDKSLAELLARLGPLKTDTCPFEKAPPTNAPAMWVRPELVAEIKFAEWTDEGYLRAPVFLRLRDDKSPQEVRLVPGNQPASSPAAAETSTLPDPPPPQNEIGRVLDQLRSPQTDFVIEVEGHRIKLSNLDKALWPALPDHRALTKRDFLIYLAQASPFMLPHLKHRPLSLTRYPNGIHGERFFQKHWHDTIPEFVATVDITDQTQGPDEYMFCHNLATLLWLGQLANIEFHTWFSHIDPAPDMMDMPAGLSGLARNDYLADRPDFIIFDLDPYIYSGAEAKGDEPELNRYAFQKVCEVAGWVKELLDSLGLAAFVKTSGKTGLHIYVPIVRRFDYATVRAAAGTVGGYIRQRHPNDVTTEWAVEKRTGKVFLDYNQNVRGKTLAAPYSPRPTPQASISIPLRWDELGKVYPTDFTILTATERLDRVGDLWSGILDFKRDLNSILGLKVQG